MNDVNIAFSSVSLSTGNSCQWNASNRGFQISYEAQFRINEKKGEFRLSLIVSDTAIQRFPGTSPSVQHDSHLYVRISIKDNEVELVPDEPDISRRKRNFCRSEDTCPEILLFSIEQDL